MTPTEAANIIADQLGGGFRKLAATVGARDFVAIPGGLKFKFMRTERTKANVVQIEVNGATDLYTVSFYRISGGKHTKLSGGKHTKLSGGKHTKLGEFTDVFCGDLRPRFEEFTGLYLAL